MVAYDLLRDFKRTFNKALYDELVENSFYYAPPYLPVYGYMQQTKRWPMLCLTMMEWDSAETKADFKAYAEKYCPTMKSTELVGQVNNWPNYL